MLKCIYNPNIHVFAVVHRHALHGAEHAWSYQMFVFPAVAQPGDTLCSRAAHEACMASRCHVLVFFVHCVCDFVV